MYLSYRGGCGKCVERLTNGIALTERKHLAYIDSFIWT